MKIAFDINHPAHINFFKNTILNLHQNGHKIIIYGLNRGKVPVILRKEFSGFDIRILSRHRHNFISIIFEANILKFFLLLRSLLLSRPDIGISVGSFVFGACLKLLKVKNIQFDDDPESSKNLFLEILTADEIHTPPLISSNKKFVIFNALKEWAYLSPKYFMPNIDCLNKYGLIPYKYFFIREVSAGSLNYIDRGTYSILAFAKKLQTSYKVVFSLEEKSKCALYPSDWILLSEPVQDIHSLMYYSLAVISSGDSMAREGAMLGRPSIYCGKREMQANDIMKRKGILFQIDPSDVPSFLPKILHEEIKIPSQNELRKKLLYEWDDVTEHIINSIKSIHEKSKMEMHTANYIKKLIVSRLFNTSNYHKIKLYKIIFDFIIGKDYENCKTILPKLVNSNSIVLDIGANMGQYACRLNSIVKNGKIYAFEPYSINFASLVSMKNILRLKNVEPINSAVSDKKCSVKLIIPIIKDKLIVGTQAVIGTYKRTELKKIKYLEETVNSISIDSFVLENKISKIDLIKIDTEGAEISVLQGGYETIKKYLPVLIIEIHPSSPGLEFLQKIGYKAYVFSADKLMEFNSSNNNLKFEGNSILINTNKI